MPELVSIDFLAGMSGLTNIELYNLAKVQDASIIEVLDENGVNVEADDELWFKARHEYKAA